jgi:FixJ family two-component response regulator
VLDVMMPGMRGTELADVLRRDDPTARILYFTGFSDGLFAGVRTLAAHEAFVQKPVAKQELLDAVSLLLFNDLQGPRDRQANITAVSAGSGTAGHPTPSSRGTDPGRTRCCVSTRAD